MKHVHALSLAIIALTLLFSACKNDQKTEEGVTLLTEEAVPKSSAAEKPAAPAAPEPPQNAAGVWHYTCTKGCPGGAGAASPCATCGETLVHNQSYHGQAAATGAEQPAGTAGAAPGAAGANKQPEPPQNAAGVWHFTCPKGCEGGAGAAVPCAKCNTRLEHNKAYH